MVEYLELSIDELLLDEDNPRLGSAGNQSEALERLIELNPAHFRTLMHSIKENGIDPGDSLYVIEADESEDYIVLEGNRRLSAMKVLVNADILEATGLASTQKNTLRRASDGFDRSIVEPIRCVLFRNRTDAHDWIYRRHAGSADGEGRIQWGTLEIQRFTGDRSILDVIEFVGRNADYTTEEWASTRSMLESKKSSILARFLESAAGREHLGIVIAKPASGHAIPMLTADPAWALSVLKRIIEDVRDGAIDTRRLNKSSDIENYFAALPGEFRLQAAANKRKPKAFNEIDLKTGDAKPKGNSPEIEKQKKAATPRPRRTLSPKRHEFQPPVFTKGQRLLHEAASIDAEQRTIAAAFILRAFIEAAIDQYMANNQIDASEIHNGHRKDLSLSSRAERVIQHMEKNGTKKKELHGFRSQIMATNSAISIESLNSFAHNKYGIPTPEAVRAGWDAAIPVFIAAFGASDAN